MSRLESLRAQNDSVRAEMAIHSDRIDKIRNRDSNGTAPRVITSFNLFQTPDNIAHHMVETGISLLFSQFGRSSNNLKVLEPSAGLGRVVKAVEMLLENPQITMVENNQECAKYLYEKFNHKLLVRDFLSTDFKEKFDLIVMNPPFKQGTDIKHINHARKFLAEDGVLVSLCYDGVKQREFVKENSKMFGKLPEKSFKQSGTDAGVILLTIFS